MSNYFVTGHPIAHSLSPIIHETFFKCFGLNESYEIKDIEPENFKSEMDFFRDSEKKGFNITIPHKIEAFKNADILDDYAKRVGAVNTIKIEGGKLYGFNTDGEGFINALKKCNVYVKGKTVCILGAGGAVNSIAVKAYLEGAKEIIILARRQEQAKAICDRHGFGIGDSLENFSSYEYDILVNATPVGMHPNTGKSPVEDFKECEFVYDLIYNPSKTEFLKKAEQKGINHDNGLWMLVLQAARAFEIWTNHYPDEKMLDEAYRHVLMSLEEGL